MYQRGQFFLSIQLKLKGEDLDKACRLRFCTLWRRTICRLCEWFVATICPNNFLFITYLVCFCKYIFVILGVIAALRGIARQYLLTSFLTGVLCRNAIHFTLVLYCTISASFWNVPSFMSGRI